MSTIPTWVPPALASLFGGYLLGVAAERRHLRTQRRLGREDRMRIARDTALRELLEAIKPVRKTLLRVTPTVDEQGQVIEDWAPLARWVPEFDSAIGAISDHWEYDWSPSLDDDADLSDALIELRLGALWAILGVNGETFEILDRGRFDDGIGQASSGAGKLITLGSRILAGTDTRPEKGTFRHWWAKTSSKRRARRLRKAFPPRAHIRRVRLVGNEPEPHPDDTGPGDVNTTEG